MKSIFRKTVKKLLASVMREVMKEDVEWIKAIRQFGIPVQENFHGSIASSAQ
jgi:hypothetical protein